jgi:hypothetical protein
MKSTLGSVAPTMGEASCGKKPSDRDSSASALKDVEKIVKTCGACQLMGLKSNRPSQSSQLIPRAWPLQRWGMDLIGPLPTAQGNYKYAVVAVEYFTKWIEAKPQVNITSKEVKKFFWQNIICRFRVPKKLAIDNGKQFDSDLFKQFCHSVGMKVMFASFYHPQSIRALERANGLIFSSIKKCLFDLKKGKWADELPNVVWSHNTSKSRATRFTPFRLLY